MRSFKIEGRLKSAHYVAATTQTYRAAIDAAVAQSAISQIGTQQRARPGAELLPRLHPRLPRRRRTTRSSCTRGSRRAAACASGPSSARRRAACWSRSTRQSQAHGFATGDAAQARRRRRLRRRPSRAGRTGRAGRVRCPDSWLGDSPSIGETARTSRAPPVATVVELTFDRGDVNLAAIAIGAIVWKTDDPALRQRLERTFTPRHGRPARPDLGDASPRRSASRSRVAVRRRRGPRRPRVVGQAARGRAEVPADRVARPRAVRPARRHAVRAASRGWAGRRLTSAMVPKSVLNDLRRQAVERAARAQRSRPMQRDSHDRRRPDAARTRAASGDHSAELRLCARSSRASSRQSLHVLVRTLDQLDAVLDLDDRTTRHSHPPRSTATSKTSAATATPSPRAAPRTCPSAWRRCASSSPARTACSSRSPTASPTRARPQPRRAVSFFREARPAAPAGRRLLAQHRQRADRRAPRRARRACAWCRATT